MKNAVLMDESKLVKKAVGVLMRDLGPVETTRFLALFPLKRTESVKRHRAWQAKLDKDAFFDKVFAGESPLASLTPHPSMVGARGPTRS